MAERFLPNSEKLNTPPDSELCSEVLAFFTPSTLQSNPSLTPRTVIVEAAKPQTKTLTVTCSNNNSFVHNSSDTVPPSEIIVGGGYYRLDRLDSVVNPTVTAKLDRMAQQLGFTLPAKSHAVECNNNPPDWDESPIEDDFSAPDEKANHQQAAPSVVVSHKRSLFSNLVKRFSIPRQKLPVATNTSARSDLLAESSPKPTPVKTKQGTSKPRKLRRWFSRHFRRTKPNQTSTVKQPEDVFASAEAILEGSNLSFTSDGLVNGECRSDTPFDDDARPVRRSQVRASLLDPDQVRQCASLDGLDDESPLHSPLHKCIPTSARVAAIRRDSRNGIPLNHSSPQSNRFLAPRSTLPRSAPPVKTSSPFGLRRDNSFHASPDRVVDRVQFSSANGPIGSELCNSPLSAVKLSNPVRAATNQSGSLTATSYTPSYLSVSVAAFGYSGYLRHSQSSSNLNVAQSPIANTSASFDTIKANTISSSKRLPSGEPLTIGTNHTIQQSSQPMLSKESPKTSHRKPVTTGTSNVLVQPRRPTDLLNCDPQQQVSTIPKAEQQNTEHTVTSNAHTAPVDSAVRTTPPSPCPSSAEGTPGAVRLRRARTRNSTGNDDEQKDHWQRSSLIMLAVSHASPRSRTVPTLDRQPTLSLTEDEVLNEIDAQSGPADVDQSLPKATEKVESILVNGTPHHLEQSTPMKGCTQERLNITEETPNKDGHYFLRLAAQQESELTDLIERAERDLSTQVLDEEVSGLLRSAIGKARLLIAEKFAQFRGLCQLNLQQDPPSPLDPEAGHLFTSEDDLDGFWAIVTLQIEDVQRLFDQIEKLRSNGWKGTDDAVSEPLDRQQKIVKTPVSKRKKPPNSGNSSRKKDDDIARLKARERLQTVKRELRAKQQQYQQQSDETTVSPSGGGFMVV